MRLTVEEAVKLLQSDEPYVKLEVEAHWTYIKNNGIYAVDYWCCDPLENCGSDDYTTYETLEELVSDFLRMWSRGGTIIKIQPE